MGYLLADHVRRKTLLGGNVRPRADSGQLPCFPKPTSHSRRIGDSARSAVNRSDLPHVPEARLKIARRF